MEKQPGLSPHHSDLPTCMFLLTHNILLSKHGYLSISHPGELRATATQSLGADVGIGCQVKGYLLSDASL